MFILTPAHNQAQPQVTLLSGFVTRRHGVTGGEVTTEAGSSQFPVGIDVAGIVVSEDLILAIPHAGTVEAPCSFTRAGCAYRQPVPEVFGIVGELT